MKRLCLICSVALSLFCRPLFADNLASGRSVQLDALNAKTVLLLTDEKKFFTLDLESGKAALLADSKETWFAVDRRSQTVLSATRVEGGYNLTLYTLNNNAMNPIAKGFAAMYVDELQSIKSKDGPAFLLSGSAPTIHAFDKDNIPLFGNFVIRSSGDGKLETTPLPGLSEISDWLRCGLIEFSGDDQGTFAYGTIASSTSLIAIDDSVKMPDLNPGTNGLFLVISKGKVKYAWPDLNPSPRDGRVLGFSDNGRQLLAWLGTVDASGTRDWSPRLIDLQMGKMTSWFVNDPYEVLAVDGTLKRAIVQAQYGLPVPGSPPDAPLPKPGFYTGKETFRWQAQLIEENKPALKILQVDGGDTELAGTFIEGKFYATDGKTLATVDEKNHVANTPIDFSK